MIARSTLYIPALTLPFSSVFFDSFSITLLYSRRRGSWLWHSPVNTNTAVICVMGLSLNLTTPIKFSLTLINSDVHCILCKVYNRVDSSNITSQTWIFYFFRFFSQKTETEFWLLYRHSSAYAVFRDSGKPCKQKTALLEECFTIKNRKWDFQFSKVHFFGVFFISI